MYLFDIWDDRNREYFWFDIDDNTLQNVSQVAVFFFAILQLYGKFSGFSFRHRTITKRHRYARQRCERCVVPCGCVRHTALVVVHNLGVRN